MSAPSEHLAPALEHPATLRLTISPSLSTAREASVRVRSFLAGQGVSEEEQSSWELVAAEALTNAVSYPPAERANFPVEVDVVVTKAFVELRVADHTDGFTMPKVATLPPDDSESGRGLYLILTLTDRADYLRGEHGNTLVLRRARTGPPTGPPRTVEELEAELGQMTEELAASFESLASIFQFTAELGNAEEPMKLVGRWMSELARITGADWHSFHALDSVEKVLNVVASVGEYVPEQIKFDPGEDGERMGLAGRAIVSRQDVWFDPRTTITAEDPLRALIRGCSGLVHPVFVGSTLIGIAAFGRRVDGYPFTAGQVNVIHTFADFLGSQVRVAQVQRDAVATQVLRREVEIAASIQHSLLPSYIPRLPGHEIAGSAMSAREVGGDFYDVLEVRPGALLLVIADVMGKGIPAALFAAILRTLIRSRRDLADQPDALMDWLNVTVFPDFERVEMFATVQLVFLNTMAEKMTVCSAGHCPLLVVSQEGELTEIAADGIPIGIAESAAYPSQDVAFPPGSRALMFTDGLMDAANPEGTQFGLDQLRTWLATAAAATPTSLRAVLAAHESGAASADDQTFLLINAHLSPATPHPSR